MGNRSTIPFPDDKPPTEEETKAETDVKAKINKLRTEYLRHKAESKPKPTQKPRNTRKPKTNPNQKHLNLNTDSNVYNGLNTTELNPIRNEDWPVLNNDNLDPEWMQLCRIDLNHDFDLDPERHMKPKPMHIVKINDWFTMNNDNINIEWRRLNMINLDNDLDHKGNAETNLDTTDRLKTKTLHTVKLNDWYTMNNDNISIEWRQLNMINLDYNHDKDLETNHDMTSLEWNRLNLISADALDPDLDMTPEPHSVTLRKIGFMQTSRIDNWLASNNRDCNIQVEKSSLTKKPIGVITPLKEQKPSPAYHTPLVTHSPNISLTRPPFGHNITRNYDPENEENVVLNHTNTYPKIISRTPQTKRKLIDNLDSPPPPLPDPDNIG